jgi:hypothetical protein
MRRPESPKFTGGDGGGIGFRLVLLSVNLTSGDIDPARALKHGILSFYFSFSALPCRCNQAALEAYSFLSLIGERRVRVEK